MTGEAKTRQEELARVTAKGKSRRKAGVDFEAAGFGKLGQKLEGTFEAPPPIKLPSRQGRAGAGGGLTALPKTKAELARDKATLKSDISDKVSSTKVRIVNEIDNDRGSGTSDAARVVSDLGPNATPAEKAEYARQLELSIIAIREGVDPNQRGEGLRRIAGLEKIVDNLKAGRAPGSGIGGLAGQSGQGPQPGAGKPSGMAVVSESKANAGIVAAAKSLRADHVKEAEDQLAGLKGKSGEAQQRAHLSGVIHTRKNNDFKKGRFLMHAIFASGKWQNSIVDAARAQDNSGNVTIKSAQTRTAKAAIDALEADIGPLSEEIKTDIRADIARIYGRAGVWTGSKQ